MLRSNGFHGRIKSPETNYTFPRLHNIDLSHNSFSGNLPVEYFLHWNAIKVVGENKSKYMDIYFIGFGLASVIQYTFKMINKGIELEYEKIKDAFTVIDFSSNRFRGEISKLVESLEGLHLLNFSNNGCTGQIPSSLGNLTDIESINLSQNNLLEEIPQQLT